MMEDPNSSSSSTKFVLVGILSLVHFVSVATSFEVSFPLAGRKSSGTRTRLNLQQGTRISQLHPDKFSRRWPRVSTEDDHHSSLPFFPRTFRTRLGLSSELPEPDAEKSADAAYNDLYEFLTKRTGEGAAAETERKRKRDRIKDFMATSSSSSSEGKNLVQPIRVEDGQVDTELVSQQEEEQQARVKVRFDTLFTGMPTLEEIISRGPTEEETEQPTFTSTKKRTGDDDFSWFEPERLRIEGEYEQLRQETKAQIQEQRIAEAAERAKYESEMGQEENAIPNNAESIADAIVTQEMNRMINSVRIERAKQRLQAYESERSFDSQQDDAASDDIVDKIFKDTAEELERSEKLQSSVDSYREYERMRKEEAALQEAQEENVPSDGADLDDWTLDRLEEMLEKSESLEDGDASIIDTLEESIDELRRQMARQPKKGSIQPETMKEQQMYQAIASRLTEQQKNIGSETSKDDFDEIMSGESNESTGTGNRMDEVQMTKQLDSWRQYIEKEDELRQDMGLGSDYDLPFGHLGTKADRIKGNAEDESVADNEGSLWDGSEGEGKAKSRREMRRDVNIQAIQAMENLIGKSDSRRSAFLQKQLESIKIELEESDYYDIDEEEELPASMEPVDLSGVFNKDSDGDTKKESSLSREEMDGVNQILSFSGTGAQYSRESAPKPEPPNTPFFQEEKPAPPNTPFFQDDNYDDEDDYESTEKAVPVPNTPFFQDRGGVSEEEEEVDVDNKLGSVDEQKLQRMFRQNNVRSIAEQDAIRQNWEAYQAYEKSIRDKAGLSKGLENEDPSSLTDNVQLQYNVDDVMTGDGDIDAEKVLSTIGPRPTKRSKSPESAAVTPPSTPSEKGSSRPSATSSEAADAIYRSVSASGGIGREDKAVRDKDRAEYEAYLQREEQMKMDLEDLEDDIDEVAAEVGELVDIDVEDADYADEVLPSRPVWKRKKKKEELKFTKEVSEPDNTDKTVQSSSPMGAQGDDLVPDWLKKERQAAGRSEGGGGGIGGAFLGGNIGDVADNDQKERQIEEYKRNRAEEQGRMGIDITDAIGRRGSDDSRDYTFDKRSKRTGWGAASFEAQKANLLGYIELDPSELNNLMAYKDSEDATGASQYLPRINKPFKEFGAIFRLEGVLVDITGLQQRAWNRVASQFDLKEPLLEDVKRAAVLKPEEAIRELFFTVMGDFVMVRKIVDAYRLSLRTEFDAWAIEEGLSVKTASEPQARSRGSLALGFENEVEEEEVVDNEVQPLAMPLEEGSRLRYLQEAWTKTANQFSFPVPANEQIAESSLVSPDIAVSSIFDWSQDQKQINKIVAAYSILQAGGVIPIEEENPEPQAFPKDRPLTPEEVTDEMILELQFMAWEEVAEENNFDELDPEEVLAAASINNPEVIILDGFQWTDDPDEATKLASSYREYFSQFINQYIHKRPYTRKAASNNVVVNEAPQTYAAPTMPTEEEILSSQVEAWKETAAEFYFDNPSIEQIRSVADLSPEEAVSELLYLNYDIANCDTDEVEEFESALPEMIETYTTALGKFAQIYMKKYERSTQPKPTSVPDSSEEMKTLSQDDIYCASFDAWTHVAWKNGFTLPVQDEVEFSFTVGPKEAVTGAFGWTESDEEADNIVQQYLDQIKIKRDEWIQQGYVMTEESDSNNVEEESIPLVSTRPGVFDWVNSLKAVEMGCGVVTHLEKDQMQILLQYAGLSDLFPDGTQVSHSNGYLRDNQQLLGVSLRIERRPDHCVIFDTSPLANVGAHEYDMRSVAIIGPFPRYELLSADTTAASIEELNAASIRRLFGERINDQPMLDTENSNPLQPITKVQTKTQFAGDE